MLLAEPIEVTLALGRVLDALGVPWLVGGSLASSLHGIPRATQDVDIVADLFGLHVRPFVDAVEGEFYVSDDAVREAVRRRATFNVIHLATMTKVDVFLLRREPLAMAEMERRQFYSLDETRSLPVASPEDIILQKLDWYRKGDRISERQWRDVIGVLRVSGQKLDRDYLAKQAASSGLVELLGEALGAATS
ncbi:MAG: nucleotidyl transferase AbiEii/AbiGii toxin family protein [Pseudomonadota bacterium]